MKTGTRSTAWAVAAVILAAAGPSCAPAPAKPVEGKWIRLFNGRDLAGWTAKIADRELGDNYLDTFRAGNGVLRVCYDKYQSFDGKFGHIFHDWKLSSYRLRLEYRFTGEQAPGGPGWAFRNSGIMIHCQHPKSMRRDQAFPVCLEVQLLGGDGKNERTTGNLCTPGMHVVMNGALETTHCISARSKTYHGDRWVRAEVEVRGGRVIRHFIEGEPVIEYEQPQLDEGDADARNLLRERGNKEVTEGYISLQAESHPVEFRNIEVMALGAE